MYQTSGSSSAFHQLSNGLVDYRFLSNFDGKTLLSEDYKTLKEKEITRTSLEIIALNENKSFRIEFSTEYSIEQGLSEYEGKNCLSQYFNGETSEKVCNLLQIFCLMCYLFFSVSSHTLKNRVFPDLPKIVPQMSKSPNELNCRQK